MYRDLAMVIKQCHDDALTILPDFSSLLPSDSFAARALPPTEYNGYPTALACYTKLMNYIRVMLETKYFAHRAPTA